MTNFKDEAYYESIDKRTKSTSNGLLLKSNKLLTRQKGLAM
jgi:hypothetical protein